MQHADRDYMDAKRYMAEYRGKSIPARCFQNELLLRQTDHTGALAVRTRDILAKLRESPYFARIDFSENGSLPPVPCYIGRFTFRHNSELLVFDWRAPVSSMFYDYETGPAGYDSPMGRVEGIITRKRQFKIADGVMEYAIESSSSIQDDILQKNFLTRPMKNEIDHCHHTDRAKTRSSGMKATKTMIIQGVAGSGKTSIALHRIAFLLYRFKTS